MKLLGSVFAAGLLVSSLGLRAQTAEEIVSKHISAIGGQDAISKVTSQTMESEISVMGSTLTGKTIIWAGKGFKNVANFNGQEIIQVVTPTSGWMINPLQGNVDPQPLPEDQLKASQAALEIGSELVNYREKGKTIESLGKEKIDGVETLKLKLTTKEGSSKTIFIDPSTYYISRIETTANLNGQELKAISSFSDYKKTDSGLVIPFSTVVNQGFEMAITLKKIEFNNKIDPKIFDMPKNRFP